MAMQYTYTGNISGNQQEYRSESRYYYINTTYTPVQPQPALPTSANPRFTRVGWNVHRLTKILSLNVIQWGLLFNIVLFAVHALLPSVLDLIGQKKVNSKYDVIIWTFQPMNLHISGLRCFFFLTFFVSMFFTSWTSAK